MKKVLLFLLMSATVMAQSDCQHTVWNTTLQDSTMLVVFVAKGGEVVQLPAVIVCWSDTTVQVVLDSWVLGYPSRRYKTTAGSTPAIKKVKK